MKAKKVWAATCWLGVGFSASGVLARGQAQDQVDPRSAVTAAGVASPDSNLEASKPAMPSGILTVTFGGKSSQWTAAALAALQHKTLTLLNPHTKVSQTFSGVELIDLLTPLGVPAKPHGKEFRIYVVAEGSDGYQVVYSIGEVTPDVHDGTVLVADTLEGKPIGASGPLQLVCTGEKRPARWVRNLTAIRVLSAE